MPIDPLRLCEEVRRVLPRDAVFIVDGHETLEFARRWIPSLSEANYLTSGPNGCMGVGVPFALGAAVARPDRPVFVLMGDGGFGWHGMEYDTLIRHSLPMVGIVFNNAGFTARPAAAGTGRELGYQRYDFMVAGFGGHGEFVERPEDIAPALQRAIESGKPALVNVCVDPDAQAAGGLLGELGSETSRPTMTLAIEPEHVELAMAVKSLWSIGAVRAAAREYGGARRDPPGLLAGRRRTRPASPAPGRVGGRPGRRDCWSWPPRSRSSATPPRPGRSFPRRSPAP